MIERLIAWDKSLLLSLNGSDSLFLDGLFWTVTQTVTWIPVLLCVLYLIVKNNRQRELFLLLFILVMLVLMTDQVSSGICKPYFHRLRPSHNPQFLDQIDLVNGYRGGLYGFISSHAANTFGAACFLSLLIRSFKASAYLFTWACICSYSRIYLGVHYPADICCGALCGLLCAVLTYFLWLYLRRFASAPQSYYSTTYTSSGYAITDIDVLGCAFALTYIYIVVRAVIYASSL